MEDERIRLKKRKELELAIEKQKDLLDDAPLLAKLPDKGARIVKRYKELKMELNRLLGKPENEISTETVEELAENFEKNFSLKPSSQKPDSWKNNKNFQKIRNEEEDEEMKEITTNGSSAQKKLDPEDEDVQMLQKIGALREDFNKMEEDDEEDEEIEEESKKDETPIEDLWQYVEDEFETLKKTYNRFLAKNKKREKIFKNLKEQYEKEQERLKKQSQEHSTSNSITNDIKMNNLRTLRLDLVILNGELEKLQTNLKFSFKTLMGLKSDLQLRLLTEKMTDLEIRRKKQKIDPSNEKKIEIDNENEDNTEIKNPNATILEIDNFLKETTIGDRNSPHFQQTFTLPENPFDSSNQNKKKQEKQERETIILSLEEGIKAELLEDERTEKVRRMLTEEELAFERMQEMKDVEFQRKMAKAAEDEEEEEQAL